MNTMLEELKKLKDMYYDTIVCELGEGLQITLRLLTSEEETDVHSYSSKYEQGIAYLYSIKRETLGRAITILNGNKIPEILIDGEEKVQKHLWLRDNIIKGWSQVLIDEIWQKYADLLVRVEAKISGSIKKEEETETVETEEKEK